MLVSCSVSYRAAAQDPLFRRFLSDRQTPFEQRIFEKARYVHGEVSTNYQSRSENRTAERERNELLRKAEGESNQRRTHFNRYRRFFERGYSGSSTALTWWQAYDNESEQEQPSVSDLLQLARKRAEKGLNRMREMETSFSSFLQREEFEQADLFIDEVRRGQENFETEGSVFPPLVTVHNKVKRLENWASYRRELETFVKELEDLLDSPLVRTAPANRVRFPSPGSGVRTDPGRSDIREHVESNKPYQGGLTDEERAASNRQMFKWVAIPVGIIFLVLVGLAFLIDSNPSPEQIQACMEAVDPTPECQEIIVDYLSGDYMDYDPVTGEPR